MKEPGRLRGMTTNAITFDDFSEWPEATSDGTMTQPKEKKLMTGNTMMVPYDRYLALKATGRVRGGDPTATASEPIVYTDENGIEWSLSVSIPSTAGPNLNTGPRQPAPLNRHQRRAQAAQKRRAK